MTKFNCELNTLRNRNAASTRTGDVHALKTVHSDHEPRFNHHLSIRNIYFSFHPCNFDSRISHLENSLKHDLLSSHDCQSLDSQLLYNRTFYWYHTITYQQTQLLTHHHSLCHNLYIWTSYLTNASLSLRNFMICLKITILICANCSVSVLNSISNQPIPLSTLNLSIVTYYTTIFQNFKLIISNGSQVSLWKLWVMSHLAYSPISTLAGNPTVFDHTLYVLD